MTNTIGIAGAGNMGTAIARRLKDTGANVLLLTPPSGVSAHHDGLETVADARTLASRSDVVLSCLRTGAETALVLPGLLEGAVGKSGFIHIDHGNGAPDVARLCAEKWVAQGQLFADAPLLGPPEHLSIGKATLLVGATAEGLARVTEISEPFCDNVVHAGAIGQGHVLRQLLNFMGYGLVALSASTIAAASAAGIAPEVLRDAASGKGLDSGTFQTLLANAIDTSLPHRPLSVRYIRGEYEKMRAAFPNSEGADLLMSTLNEFYCMVDGGQGDKVMATALPDRLQAIGAGTSAT